MTSRLLIHEPPLQVLPSLAVAVGLNEAIILQQLHYWLENPKVAGYFGIGSGGNKWIYNTYEDWQEQFPFWSLPTIKRAFNSLIKQGVVISNQLAKHQHDMTNYYRIDYRKMDDLMDGIKMIPSKGSKRSDDNRNYIDYSENTLEAENEKQKTVIESANQAVDAMLDIEAMKQQALATKKTYLNRERFQEQYWPNLDAFVKSTNMKPLQKDVANWTLALEDWRQLEVQPGDVLEAVKQAKGDDKNRGFHIGSPHSLTNTLNRIVGEKTFDPEEGGLTASEKELLKRGVVTMEELMRMRGD